MQLALNAQESKKNLLDKLGIAAAGIVLVLSITTAQANAFSFTSIITNIANLIGVDVSVAAEKLLVVEGFAQAVLSQDWGSAAEIASGALGSFKSVDPQKLQTVISQSAQGKYNQEQDFGIGFSGAELLEELEVNTGLGKAQDDVNMGESAQEGWIKKGEVLTKSVEHGAEWSEQAGQATNSLKVLRIMSGQFANLTGVVGQSVTEERQSTRAIYQAIAAMNRVASSTNQQTAEKVRGWNASAQAVAATAGVFQGLTSPRNSPGSSTPVTIANGSTPGSSNNNAPLWGGPTTPSGNNPSGSSNNNAPLWGGPTTPSGNNPSGSSNNNAPLWGPTTP
jgi:hypothetical protein